MEKTNLTLEDVAACLDRIGLQYLATIGLDGKPKVRPVQYMIIRDRKLWFCTNSEKSMYAELQNNPYVDLCASRLEQDEIKTEWIRFSAEAFFPENEPLVDIREIREIKKLIIQKSAIVHELYDNDPDNPVFKVFYLKNIHGSMNNLGHIKGLSEKKAFSKPIYFVF